MNEPTLHDLAAYLDEVTQGIDEQHFPLAIELLKQTLAASINLAVFLQPQLSDVDTAQLVLRIQHFTQEITVAIKEFTPPKT